MYMFQKSSIALVPHELPRDRARIATGQISFSLFLSRSRPVDRPPRPVFLSILGSLAFSLSPLPFPVVLVRPLALASVAEALAHYRCRSRPLSRAHSPTPVIFPKLLLKRRHED